ncbi:MAG: imidazole glycerol phosphate synthase subunit HisF [Phycisphaerales bacterium]|nr:imidazole glycerol phosphate synthase subunit HisF [Phycisphaerales bacterium]
MIRPRLIPCLFIKNGLIVRSQRHRVHQVIGNPISSIMRLSNWNVDELVVIDIGGEDRHDLRRDDLHIRDIGDTMVEIIRAVSDVCFMPLTVGGGIRTVDDIADRLAAGADKCMLNTAALERPTFVTDVAQRFGAQCIVVNLDVIRHEDGRTEVLAGGGALPTGLDPVRWARTMERCGAGELFVNSVDRDGSGRGYDLPLLRAIADAVTVPVIGCGGAGESTHFVDGLVAGGVDAVAAGNIFHFRELSYPHAKQCCLDAGLPMRPVRLGSRWCPREPVYDADPARRRHRPRRSRHDAPAAPMRWCSRCVYPFISAAPMEFADDGVCMGCHMADVKATIPPEAWSRRREALRDVLDRYRNRDGSGYDCIIPVSGGKDSYFQTHVITREFGLRPLLVTYNGNNYTEAGWRNVHRMKEVFDVDHQFFSPSVRVLKTLNRLAFEIMGDMNWHAHVGITTVPVRAAVQTRTPLVIWGEHGYLDLCGQFSMDDFPEMSYRDRLEHFARGYEWNYFVGLDGLAARDLVSYQYPSDAELLALDVRGIYLGNYVYWEANEHTQLMIDEYGWEPSDEPFDRTYRRMSNLDDMHENGVHDYLKYIKFGYGRCTDHVCKDIRAGRMTRAEGLALVRRYDHVKPRDLARWLDYVGMTEAEFDAVADTFRDPRVWRRERGTWIRDEPWNDAADQRDDTPAPPTFVTA